ncbi:DUF3047 domain-containing protein [Salinisphaera sp. T31B1]|uniref:DUF3047 domain-containing protein n=1 Tax=Salinisphaera sp. T31B1 TaxID=727963 RepID=UPI00333E7C5C
MRADRRGPTPHARRSCAGRRTRIVAGFLCALTCTGVSAADAWVGRFAPNSLTDWESRSFKGQTTYRLIGDGATRTLEARCQASASAIALRRQIDLVQTPVLRWQWRIDHVHEGLDGRTREGDDYAARVYVIHDGGALVWRTRAINYVWANTEPRDTHWPNAFTDKAMMVAVQSGTPAEPDQWVEQSRNVRDDFKRFYGLDLSAIDGVALMTDCDNGGRSARAEYRRLRFTAQ